jgi:hypothetical protein
VATQTRAIPRCNYFIGLGHSYARFAPEARAYSQGCRTSGRPGSPLPGDRPHPQMWKINTPFRWGSAGACSHTRCSARFKDTPRHDRQSDQMGRARRTRPTSRARSEGRSRQCERPPFACRHHRSPIECDLESCRTQFAPSLDVSLPQAGLV